MESKTAELIGKRIKFMREKNNLKIKELSVISGFAASSLQNYEVGIRQPSLDALKRLASALNCSASWLSTLENDDNYDGKPDYNLINQPFPAQIPLERDSVMFSTVHVQAAGGNVAFLDLVKVAGSLMAPDVAHGDEVLIDKRNTIITEQPDIYCVTDQTQQRIIRWAIREFGKDGYTLYSNNDSHFPPVFVPDDSETISVIGRVISIVRWR